MGLKPSSYCTWEGKADIFLGPQGLPSLLPAPAPAKKKTPKKQKQKLGVASMYFFLRKPFISSVPSPQVQVVTTSEDDGGLGLRGYIYIYLAKTLDCLPPI